MTDRIANLEFEIDQIFNDLDQLGLSADGQARPIVDALIVATRKLGWSGNASQLRDQIRLMDDDVDSFIFSLKNLGFRCISAPLVSIYPAPIPPFLVSNEQSCHLVLECSTEGYLSFDPFTRTISLIQLRGDENVVAVEDYARTFREPPPDSRGKREWLQDVFFQYRQEIIMLLALSIGVNLLGALSPLFVSWIYSKALSSDNYSTLMWFSSGALLVALGEYFLKSQRLNILHSGGRDLSTYISYSVLSKLLWLPYKVTVHAEASAQIARLRDVEHFRKLVTSESTASYLDLPFVFIYLLAVWSFAGSLALLIVVGMFIFAGFGFGARLFRQAALKKTTTANLQVRRLWAELFSDLHAIRRLPLRYVLDKQFTASLNRSIEESSALDNTLQRISSNGQLITQIIGVITLVLTVFLIMDGHADPGALLAINMLMWKILNPMMGIYNSIAMAQSTKISGTQINQLMAMEDDRALHEKQVVALEVSGGIKIQGVSFRHPDAATALSNISFECKPRERIAISGPSGCGKTTLLNIMLNMQDNYQGKVLVDGVNLRQSNPHIYRTSTAYCPTEIFIFKDTLRDNFRFYNSLTTDDAAIQALETFELTTYFPEGLDTVCTDEHMARLPSGAIEALKYSLTLTARVAGLVIIDEPATHLDAKLHHRFLSLLDRLQRDAMIILCTNNPNLVSTTSQTLVLDSTGAQKFFGASEKALPTLGRL